MRRTFVIAILMLFPFAGAPSGWTQTKVLPKARAKAQPMNDAALDKVTAGTVSAEVSNGVIKFQGQAQTPNGLVSSDGSLGLQSGPLGSTTMGTLSMNGNAEQNLSSLVNINAVNSKINVLLNLNVNINSTVGTLTQSNLNGKH
jgi:hypothetical protein